MIRRFNLECLEECFMVTICYIFLCKLNFNLVFPQLLISCELTENPLILLNIPDGFFSKKVDTFRKAFYSAAIEIETVFHSLMLIMLIIFKK